MNRMFATGCILLIPALLVASCSHSSGPQDAETALTLSVVSKFHMKLNSRYKQSGVVASYMGPLAYSGRTLVLLGDSRAQCKWSVGMALSESEVQELFRLRISSGAETGAVTQCEVAGTRISVSICDMGSDSGLAGPDMPLPALSGMTAREFLNVALNGGEARAGGPEKQ